jgi:hypothetical protein
MTDAAVAVFLRDVPSDVLVTRIAARRAADAGLPLVLLVALAEPRGADLREDSRPQHLQSEAAAVCARVCPTLQELRTTAGTRVAVFQTSLDPAVRRRHATEAAVGTAAGIGAALVTEVSVGLNPDHPVLTRDGAVQLEQRMSRCRTELAGLADTGRDGATLDLRTRLWDELAGLQAVLRSAEVRPDDREPRWVEVGCRVRIDTCEGGGVGVGRPSGRGRPGRRAHLGAQPHGTGHARARPGRDGRGRQPTEELLGADHLGGRRRLDTSRPGGAAARPPLTTGVEGPRCAGCARTGTAISTVVILAMALAGGDDNCGLGDIGSHRFKTADVRPRPLPHPGRRAATVLWGASLGCTVDLVAADGLRRPRSGEK